MCIILHIRRYSPGPFYYTGQSTPPETIYLPQDRPRRNLLGRARELAHDFRYWLRGGYDTPDHRPSNGGHPPAYDDDLEDGPPTPPNEEDCPDLIFEDEGEGCLSAGVEVKSFGGVDGK